jgi:TolB-like protein
VQTPASASPLSIAQHATPGGWRPRLAVLLALLLAIPVGVTIWRSGLGASVGRATPMITIAVLPFAEYSGDAADARLAARLTDGVTGELARIRTLGVVSHTSAQQFSGTRPPLGEIAKALSAELILEGRVFRDGDSVRVEARLVDASVDRKVWVSDFVGRLTDLPDLEQRIARAAAPAAEQARGSGR